MKKLEELIYNQMELVKYMNESKTRTDRMFYKNEIDVMETLIENMRKELKQYYIAYINGDINDTNKEYVSVLRKCDTWEEALEIANNWII